MTDQSAPQSWRKRPPNGGRPTSIDMKPGVIRFRALPDRATDRPGVVPAMIWLMLKGHLPSPSKAHCWKPRWSPPSTTAPRRPRSQSDGWAVHADFLEWRDGVGHQRAGRHSRRRRRAMRRAVRRHRAPPGRRRRAEDSHPARPRRFRCGKRQDRARAGPHAFIRSIRARRGCSNSSTRRATTTWYPTLRRDRPRRRSRDAAAQGPQDLA